jgi:hypothetical protein
MIGRLPLGQGQATARAHSEILLAIFYIMRELYIVLEEEKPTKNALRLKYTECWAAALGAHRYGPTLCRDLQSLHNGCVPCLSTMKMPLVKVLPILNDS